MRRLWRSRQQKVEGSVIVARGQRAIDVAAVLLLLLGLAVAALAVIGLAHAVVWAWSMPVPLFVRGIVTFSLLAAVAVGAVGLKVVLER